MDLIDKIKYEFQSGDRVTQLLIVNIAIFISIYLLNAFYWILTGTNLLPIIENLFSLPTNLNAALYKPWTLITYMFVHIEFMHLLWNMLFFYWLGSLATTYFSNKQIVQIYLIGGIVGAVFTLLAVKFSPALALTQSVSMTGASAAIMAVIIAATTLGPSYNIPIFLLFNLPLWVVVSVFMLKDVYYLTQSGNAAGIISHFGGSLFGFLYVKLLQNGIDFGKYTRPRPVQTRMTFEHNRQATHTETHKDTYFQGDITQEQIDTILDKIKISGYDALTKDEKRTLREFGTPKNSKS